MAKARIPLLLLLMVLCTVASAERYRGDPRDAKPVRALLGTLADYRVQFARLLEMRGKIEPWRARLNDTDARIGRELQAQAADRAQLKKGALSDAEFKAKWDTSGRAKKVQQDLAAFKQEQGRYNDYVHEFNTLAGKLSPHLKKRSPDQVESLLGEIDKLSGVLNDALTDGNYVKASYVAGHSALAAEFGYVSH